RPRSMVYRSLDSASPDPRPALLSEDALVTALRAQQILARHFVRMCRGILRGNWRDRFCLPWNVRSAPRVFRGSFLRFAVGLWHLPVVDYLGTATPHGAYWYRFFLAFAAAMTPMRVLISWRSARTNSVLLAQLRHAASTGSLVVFSPPRVS